jgi:hypothetical protein
MKYISIIATTTFLGGVWGHYTLDFPPTTGFDEDQEPNAPCGGFDPTTSNLTAFPLAGGPIAIDSHHPQMTLIIRSQLIGSEEWVNLTDGYLVMTGLGELCVPALPVPANWSGQVGVIQVVGQPPDAVLYQVHSPLFEVNGVCGG